MGYLFRRILSDREYPGIKLIVFDFDGTLADTRKLFLRIIKKHLVSFEISLSKNLLKFFGNTPLEQYLELIEIPQKFTRDVYSGIISDFKEESHKIKPCKGFIYVKNIEAKKVIVSNNVTSFIEKSLNYLHANFFDGVYGADSFKNKVWMINKLCKKYKLSKSEVVYVGDKDIDVDIARGVGCYSVIISNKSSWSLRKDVLKKKPDYLLTDLSKLNEVINEINSEQLNSI